MGSYAVYNGFGVNARELAWFVKLGMTNEQALQAATVAPAEMLREPTVSRRRRIAASSIMRPTYPHSPITGILKT